MAAEFLEHAQEERQHADRLATRIVRLGASRTSIPTPLTSRSHAGYEEHADDLRVFLERLPTQ